MKKLIIIAISIIVLCIGCIMNSTDVLAQNTSYYRYDNNTGHATSIRTFYDSKKRPHRIVVISRIHGVTCVDLDANTYNK